MEREILKFRVIIIMAKFATNIVYIFLYITKSSLFPPINHINDIILFITKNKLLCNINLLKS